MSWQHTFEGIDPTLFNFLSDVVGIVFQTVFTMALGHAFVFLMSKHIQGGGSIPARVLGRVPENFCSSTWFCHLLQWSMPALLVTLLLAMGDFSHSIADLGLSFVTVSLEGPPETVVSLNRRNPARLMELSGDPSSSRTRAFPTSAVDALLTDGDYAQGRRDGQLIANFLVAIDDVARGGSPLANYTVGNRMDLDYGGVASSVFTTANDNHKPLAQIDFEIPLNCATSQMVSVPQVINGYAPDEIFPLENVALLPNCSYNTPRTSGIFSAARTSNGQAEVIEYLIPRETSNLTLDQLGTYSRNVIFTPSEKMLARDRDEWKQGRVVNTINGVKYGDLEIRFSTTVLATGDNGEQPRLRSDDGLTFVPTRYYFLVSNIFGACPPLPSGRQMDNDVDCVVVSVLLCDDVFQEDIEPLKPMDFKDPARAEAFESSYPQSKDSTCNVHNMNIVWGRNFVVDDELLAVLSAVITRARLNSFLDTTTYRSVVMNGALAALFALASTKQLASNNDQVRPTINAIYVVFLLIPLLLAALMLVATFNRSKLPIPTNSWELMVQGREETSLPTRPRQGESEFPNSEARQYEFAIRKDANAIDDYGNGRLGIYRIKDEASVGCLTSLANK